MQNLKHSLSENYQRLIGNRKLGARLNETTRSDGLIPKSKINSLERLKTFNPVDGRAFENFFNQFQGNTNNCVAYTITHWCSYYASAKFNERIFFDAKVISEILKIAGILTKQGAYIDEAVEYIWKYSQAQGIFDQKGIAYRLGEAKSYKRSAIPDLLAKGYPIITGALIKFPMIDSEYFYRKATALDTAGGHAFPLVPHKKVKTDDFVFAENSWKYFGIPYSNGKLKSGQFKVQKRYTTSLFRPFIFDGIERI